MGTVAKVVSTVLVVFTLMAPYRARAGDLNPPPGPIMATHRTPISDASTPGDADSTFKITQAGSYYLRGNITGVAGEIGIEIAAAGVTLDLMGFQLLGGAGTFDGIRVSLPVQNVAIRNGAILGWGQDGVDCSAVQGGNILEGLRASGNTTDGIRSGVGSVVTGCTADNNGGDGFDVSNATTITGCAANLNTGNGFSSGNMAVITNCSALTNTLDGFATGNGATIVNCSARDNTENGFDLGLGCTVTSCSAYVNTLNGIDVGDGCTVSNCTARLNGARGIMAADAVTITGCTADVNVSDGIRVNTNSQVTNNTCNDNGNGLAEANAGIRLDGAGNRAEGNTLTSNNNVGIEVDAAGNLVIRNWCRGNTTPICDVGNSLIGPIVTTANIATEDSAQANFTN